MPDMTGLKVLELRSRCFEGCWNTLNRLTGISGIVKLTCWNSSFNPYVLSTLQAFTALQHLVISEAALRVVDWGELVLLTTVTKLDIGHVALYQSCTSYCASLLKAVAAMTQLASLKLSVDFGCSKTEVLHVLAALGTNFSGLVQLRELSVLCVVPQTWQICAVDLQSRWQALLKDAMVHVTCVSGSQWYHCTTTTPCSVVRRCRRMDWVPNLSLTGRSCKIAGATLRCIGCLV